MKITTASSGLYGDITGDFEDLGYTVLIQNADGEIFVHQLVDLTEQQAKQLADNVNKKGEVDLQYWTYWRTVYGSAAYMAEEEEAWEAAEMIRNGLAYEDEFKGTAVGCML